MRVVAWSFRREKLPRGSTSIDPPEVRATIELHMTMGEWDALVKLLDAGGAVELVRLGKR